MIKEKKKNQLSKNQNTNYADVTVGRNVSEELNGIFQERWNFDGLGGKSL